jgi:hypothetical protein
MVTGRTRRALTLSALALATAMGGALLAIAEASSRYEGAVLVPACTALVTVALALFLRNVGVLGLGTALLGSAFVCAQLGAPMMVGRSAVAGVLLFAMFELTSLAITCRGAVGQDARTLASWYREVAVALLAATVTTSIVATGGAAGRGVGVVLFVMGPIAAIALLVLAGSLLSARR